MLFFFQLSRVRLRALTKCMLIGDVFSEGSISAGGVTLGVGVTTGSPHSRNGSPTTGLGLSLEAGPSVTGV